MPKRLSPEEESRRLIESVSNTRETYGFTGLVGIDGILSPEQKAYLDDRQQAATTKSLEYLDNRKEDELFPMINWSTGLGKGRIIYSLIRDKLATNPTAKILIIAGTKNVLVDQTAKVYIKGLLTDADVVDIQEFLTKYPIGSLKKGKTQIQVATFQSLTSRVSKGKVNFNEYDLVLVDEVHNAGTPERAQAVRSFPHVVGFSATGHRHSGKLRAPEDYGFTAIDTFLLPDAQRLGILPSLVGMPLDVSNLLEGGKIPLNQSGHFDYAKLTTLLKASPELRPFIVDQVVPLITQPNKPFKTVFIVNYVWEALEIAELVERYGLTVGVAVNTRAEKFIQHKYHGRIPSEGALDRFALPSDDPESLQVIVSPYKIAEGADVPAAEVLVWASPTESGVRYTQVVGRVSRFCNGKKFGMVVDAVFMTEKMKWSNNLLRFARSFEENYGLRDSESGLVYLGNEEELETVGLNLGSLQLPLPTSADIDDDELIGDRWQKLLPVQAGEILLTQKAIIHNFVGDSKYEVVRATAIQLAEKYQNQSEKGVIDFRTIGVGKPVRVVTAEYTPEFLTMLAERGIMEKSKVIDNSPKTGEISLTQKTASAYQGNRRELHRIFIQIAQQMELEYSNSDRGPVVAERIASHMPVKVVTSSYANEFWERVAQKGIRKKL